MINRAIWLQLCITPVLFVPGAVMAESCWGEGKQNMPIQKQELTIQRPTDTVRAVVVYTIEVAHEVCEVGELTAGGVEKRHCESRGRWRNFTRSLFLYGADGKELRPPDRNTFTVGPGPTISKYGPCTVLAFEMTWRGYEAGMGTTSNQQAWIARDQKDLDALIAMVGKVTAVRPL